MPREIVVDWSSPGRVGKVSVFNFDQTFPVADQREAISAFLNDACDWLANTVSFSVRTIGREMVAATGALSGAWSENTGRSGVGTSSGEACPDASQVLVRWLTDDIVGSRFLKGRTFLPGLGTTRVDDGNIEGTSLAGLKAAANLLITADVGFGVWHRPVSSSGGVFEVASGSDVWPELAVLRRRRG